MEMLGSPHGNQQARAGARGTQSRQQANLNASARLSAPLNPAESKGA